MSPSGGTQQASSPAESPAVQSVSPAAFQNAHPAAIPPPNPLPQGMPPTYVYPGGPQPIYYVTAQTAGQHVAHR